MVGKTGMNPGLCRAQCGGVGHGGAVPRLVRLSTEDRLEEEDPLKGVSAGRGRAAGQGCGEELSWTGHQLCHSPSPGEFTTSSNYFGGSQGNRSVFPISAQRETSGTWELRCDLMGAVCCLVSTNLAPRAVLHAQQFLHRCGAGVSP